MLSLKDFKKVKIQNLNEVKGGGATSGGEECTRDGRCMSYTSDYSITTFGHTSTSYSGVSFSDKEC